MPKLGLTMTEGTLSKWHVRPGDAVQPGDLLFVAETEKTATDIAATEAGRIGALLAPEGSIVAVGAPVATWEAGGAAAGGAAGRLIATPLARRLARRGGIDLASIRGSGPRQRIKARDVEQALAAPSPPAPPLSTPPLSRRAGAAVARRMTEAKQTIPHFYLAAELDATRLLAFRQELNETDGRPRIGITHLLLAAAGRALAAEPAFGAVWTDVGARTVGGSDVGLAIDTPAGLLAPVVRDAGRLRLDDLAAAADALVAAARDGRLTPGDLEGGALTVSNLGMHRVAFVVPIINPGQAAILGVGAPRAAFRPDAQGAPALRQEIMLVLSADHRVLDGVRAARLLGAIVDLLERPLDLLRPNLLPPLDPLRV
jgi:pyruvate dehydrogenase E2 component (dihydrolipoamide acetyltransferase)